MPGVRRKAPPIMADTNGISHYVRVLKNPDSGTKDYVQPCNAGTKCHPAFWSDLAPQWPTCLWCAAEHRR